MFCGDGGTQSQMKTRNLRTAVAALDPGRGHRRWVVQWLAAGCMALALSLVTGVASAGDKVEQPIEFPHDIHAGKMGINCMYCHTYARRSRVSGNRHTDRGLISGAKMRHSIVALVERLTEI